MMATLGLLRRVGELRRVPNPAHRRDGVPQAEEMDGEVPAVVAFGHAPGKRPTELVAELPMVRPVAVFPMGAFLAGRVVEPQHIRDQVAVAVGHQPERMEQPGQHPHAIRPAAESKHEHLVAGLPVVHQKGVCFADFPQDPGPNGQSGDLREPLLQLRPSRRLGQSAQARVVVDALLRRVAIEHLDQPHDIRVLGTKLIVRPVAANHQVA